MSDRIPIPGETEQRTTARAIRRAMLSLSLFLLLLAVAMFLPAGITWMKGWAFLLVFLIQTSLAIVYLWRRNPAIFVARSKIHRGTKPWDRVLLIFLFPSFLALFPVAALDDGRFHWSSVPMWLVVLGYILFAMGYAGSVWVEAVNKFAEPGVRIQTDRGHKVIDTGPYAIVRHPLYLASFFLFFGMALALGSFWALIPAAVTALIIIVRTALEDRTLQNELEGYRKYAQRVRYKLVPGVW